jgi:hypothetical protein
MSFTVSAPVNEVHGSQQVSSPHVPAGLAAKAAHSGQSRSQVLLEQQWFNSPVVSAALEALR